MYLQPTSLDQAVRDAQTKGVKILAGGTDFYPSHGDVLPDFPILDITRIEELAGIAKTPNGWRIGATTTWSQIVHADLPPVFDGLKLAAREVGSVQIQNAGTIAGNLCNASPAADGVPALLTLDARVELAGPDGTRLLPLDRFLRGVRQTDLRLGEILTAIHIPDLGDAVSSFLKLGSRSYLVISIAMVAVVLRIENGCIADARVAVGACAPIAQRLHLLEADLIGMSEAKGVVQPLHLNGLTPLTDVRGSAEYRLDVVVTLIERAIHAALESA